MNSTIAPIKAAMAALKDTEARLADPVVSLAHKSDLVAAGIRVELLRRRNIQEAALVAALESAATVSVEGDNLELRRADGATAARLKRG